jgi:hypothetical protein
VEAGRAWLGAACRARRRQDLGSSATGRGLRWIWRLSRERAMDLAGLRGSGGARSTASELESEREKETGAVIFF